MHGNFMFIWLVVLMVMGGMELQAQPVPCIRPDSVGIDIGTPQSCPECKVTNPENAIDNNRATYARLSRQHRQLAPSPSLIAKLPVIAHPGDTLLIRVTPNFSGFIQLANFNVYLWDTNDQVAQHQRLSIDGSSDPSNTKEFAIIIKQDIQTAEINIQRSFAGAPAGRYGNIYDLDINYIYLLRSRPFSSNVAVKTCSGEPITLQVAERPNILLNWYTKATGGPVIHTGPVFSPTIHHPTDTTFYVATVDTITGCITKERLPIQLSVKPALDSIIVLSSNTLYGNNRDMITDILPAGSNNYSLFGYTESDNQDLFSDARKGLRDYIHIEIDNNLQRITDQRWGGNGDDLLTTAIKTPDGAFLLGGYTRTLQNGDISRPLHEKTVSTGVIRGSDTWLVKLFNPARFAFDDQSPLVWENNYGGSESEEATAMTNTLDGGYLISNISYSDDHDVSTPNKGHSDAWLLKIDGAGHKEWGSSFGGPDFDEINDILPTSDSGFLLVGNTGSRTGLSNLAANFNIWAIKINKQGEQEWEKHIGGSRNDMGKKVLPTTDGGYVIAGLTASTDGDIGGTKGGTDFLLLKIDSAGNIQWHRTYGGSGDDLLNAVLPLDNGGYLLGGYTNSPDGDIIPHNYGGNDLFLVKTDASGNIQGSLGLGTVYHDAITSMTKGSNPDEYVIVGITGFETYEIPNNNTDILLYKIKTKPACKVNP